MTSRAIALIKGTVLCELAEICKSTLYVSTYGTGVDGNAVILVVNSSTSDDYDRTVPNVEAIGVLTTLCVTFPTVDGDTTQCQAIYAVDGEYLMRRIQDLYRGKTCQLCTPLV